MKFKKNKVYKSTEVSLVCHINRVFAISTYTSPSGFVCSSSTFDKPSIKLRSNMDISRAKQSGCIREVSILDVADKCMRCNN